MAAPKHLRTFKQVVKVINEWQETNFDLKPNLI